MGATVTTGKLASAFKMPSGQNIYVLFEETYEKNCTPHTPHWNCILFGDLSAAMEHIFRHASACEGGMLQRRGGNLTPEGYIRGWLKELASPLAFPEQTVALKISKDGLYDAISQSAWPEVYERLGTIGRTDIRSNRCFQPMARSEGCSKLDDTKTRLGLCAFTGGEIRR